MATCDYTCGAVLVVDKSGLRLLYIHTYIHTYMHTYMYFFKVSENLAKKLIGDKRKFLSTYTSK